MTITSLNHRAHNQPAEKLQQNAWHKPYRGIKANTEFCNNL